MTISNEFWGLVVHEMFIYFQQSKLGNVTFSYLICNLKKYSWTSYISRNEKCLCFISTLPHEKVGFPWKENISENEKIKLSLYPKRWKTITTTESPPTIANQRPTTTDAILLWVFLEKKKNIPYSRKCFYIPNIFEMHSPHSVITISFFQQPKHCILPTTAKGKEESPTNNHKNVIDMLWSPIYTCTSKTVPVASRLRTLYHMIYDTH